MLFTPQSSIEISSCQHDRVLTAREREIALLIAAGNTNTSIANHLHISPHTANTHRKNIFRKLEVNNIASLVQVVLIR